MAEFAFDYWKRVDELRGTKTLSDIAEAMGIKEQSLRNMRSDCRYPKLSASQQLAAYLNTNVDYLISGKIESASPPTSTSTDYVEGVMQQDPVVADILASLIRRIKGEE